LDTSLRTAQIPVEGECKDLNGNEIDFTGVNAGVATFGDTAICDGDLSPVIMRDMEVSERTSENGCNHPHPHQFPLPHPLLN